MKKFEYRVYLGIDIGGSHIGIGIVGESGILLKNIDVISDNSLTPTNAVKIIYEKTKELIKLQQNESKIKIKIGGVGVGCPGQSKNGYIIAAGNLPNFSNVPFVSMIKTKMSSLFINNEIPIIILNDADAAISAEVWGKHSHHIYNGIKNIAMITIGTGVGVGLVLNGSLYQGSNGLVEGGHMIVNCNDKQKKCGCGQTGCVEIWGSAKNTVLRMEEADIVKENLSKKMSINKDSILSTPTSSPQKSSRQSSPANIISLSSTTSSSQRTSRPSSPSSPNASKSVIDNSPKGAKAIFQRASQGDIIAQQVINETAEYIAILCINLSRVVDPDIIIIGGGMAKAGKELLNLIQKYINARTWKVLPTKFKVEIAKSPDNAGIIGAALAAQHIAQSPSKLVNYTKDQQITAYKRKNIVNSFGLITASVGVLGCIVGLTISYKNKINNCHFLNAQYTLLLANIGLILYAQNNIK